MRIVQITPGSGNTFYCENCLRDAHLMRQLRRMGHDVLMVPMYLPLEIGDDDFSGDTPVFFGGINVWLQQKLSLFRKTPRWLDWLFDRRALLRWAGRKAGMTNPRELAETTMSILRAEDGRQSKELDRLIQWLADKENKPDVICLSNVLLGGLAGRLHERLGVPVVCVLQDEEGFLDSLAEPYAEQAWDLLREKAKAMHGFIAVSEFYADVMKKRLHLDHDRVHVNYVGIPTADYAALNRHTEVPTIGFLSRMCEVKGLDTLIEAYILLKKKPPLENLRLIIAGGRNVADEPFVKFLRERLQSQGHLDDVEFTDDFDAGAKLDFFRRISVLAVPEKEPTSYATYMVEALAAGVPVVQPASGVFPELAELVGGAVLHEPNDLDDLVKSLESVLTDVNLGDELGSVGRAKVAEHLDTAVTAEKTVQILQKILQSC